MNEDGDAIPGKHQIGSTGHRLGVKPETETLCMQSAPDHEFGFGILGPDAAHHPATRSGVHNISHGHCQAVRAEICDEVYD